MQPPLNPSSVAISGVVLIPLIIGIIQAIKRFAPEADTRTWFALSFVLAVVGEVVVFVLEYGGIVGLDMWASLVVLSISLGLAAGKSYDETIGSDD